MKKDRPTPQDRQAEAELKRLQKIKRAPDDDMPALGPAMLEFFKKSVQKRQTKMSRIAEVLNQLVPPTLLDHCSIDSFQRGTLTLLVDSSPHLYDLKNLLLAGLQKQIILACKTAGLSKITLKAGRWYDGDSPASSRLRF